VLGRVGLKFTFWDGEGLLGGGGVDASGRDGEEGEELEETGSGKVGETFWEERYRVTL